MNKQAIKRTLEQTGFTYADVDTPGGTVRITAHGPRVPAGDGEDGFRSTVVTATDRTSGEVLGRVRKRNQALAARAFLELAKTHGG